VEGRLASGANWEVEAELHYDGGSLIPGARGSISGQGAFISLFHRRGSRAFIPLETRTAATRTAEARATPRGVGGLLQGPPLLFRSGFPLPPSLYAPVPPLFSLPIPPRPLDCREAPSLLTPLFPSFFHRRRSRAFIPRGTRTAATRTAEARATPRGVGGLLQGPPLLFRSGFPLPRFLPPSTRRCLRSFPSLSRRAPLVAVRRRLC
jgi:hypothetical protein